MTTTLDIERVGRHSPRTVADQPRDAGVLIPVIDAADGQQLLMIRRAEHLPEHPGQMSFPGGGREPADESIEATALREAQEEVGLDPVDATVVGRLDDIRTITDYAVSPFVARVPDRQYDPGDHEVAAVVYVDVADLLDPTNYESERRELPEYGEVLVHYFHVGEHTVWGATGRIVVQLLELATDWAAPER